MKGNVAVINQRLSLTDAMNNAIAMHMSTYIRISYTTRPP